MRLRQTLKKAKAIAESHGGELLTPDELFLEGRSAWWKCKEGHEFNDEYDKVKMRKQFCPKCNASSFEHRGVTQAQIKQDIHDYVERMGGKWLNPGEYVSRHKKNIHVECKLHHRFKDAWRNISSRKHLCLRCKKIEHRAYGKQGRMGEAIRKIKNSGSLKDHPKEAKKIAILDSCQKLIDEYVELRIPDDERSQFILEARNLVKKIADICTKRSLTIHPAKLCFVIFYLLDRTTSQRNLEEALNYSRLSARRFFKQLGISGELTFNEYAQKRVTQGEKWAYGCSF